MQQNIIAIPDIHGDLDAMQASLSSAKSFLEQIENSKASHLVFLGDAVDRGPESFEVVKSIVDLKSKFNKSVDFLFGNHEAMFFKFLYHYHENNQGALNPLMAVLFFRNGGLPTLFSFMESLGFDQNKFFDDCLELSFSRRLSSETIIDFVKKNYESINFVRNKIAQESLLYDFFVNIKPFIKIDDTLFVHGGVVPEHVFDNFRTTHWLEDLESNFAQSIMSGFNGCFETFDRLNKASKFRAGVGHPGVFWTELRDYESFSEIQKINFVDLMSVYKINRIVCGHSVVPNVTHKTVKAFNGCVDLIFLDTGMSNFYSTAYCKQALVLDVNGGVFFQNKLGSFENLNQSTSKT
jgi:hypothetical protein